MGCTESVPDANAFDRPHEPLGPSLGANHGVKLPTTKQQLIVKEKLFSLSGDSFKIKHRDGTPFHNLSVKGTVFTLRDQLILQNAQGQPVLVCLRKFQLLQQAFKIYTTAPNYPGQKPSGQRVHNNTALYTYAEVERVPFSIVQTVWIYTARGRRQPVYTIERAGYWFPKKRLVKRHGQHTAALVEGGTWDGPWNSYLLTIAPGIDPCLVICLCAVCDEMDEDR